MRTAIVIYVMSMHFLVFVTTYHWAHEGAHACADLSMHPKFDHMHGGPPIDETMGLLSPMTNVPDGN